MTVAAALVLWMLAHPPQVTTKLEPFDVPAITVELPPPSNICTGDCMIPHSGPRLSRTCADKSRVLLTSEDGVHHCISLKALAPKPTPAADISPLLWTPKSEYEYKDDGIFKASPGPPIEWHFDVSLPENVCATEGDGKYLCAPYSDFLTWLRERNTRKEKP